MFTNHQQTHQVNDFAIFIFATRSQCLITPPTISGKEMVTHGVYFQHRNDSKISTLIKVCWSRSAKTCHAKGRELNLRIYSQLRRVDCRSRKISAVCLMLLWQNRSTFCRFIGSAARRHCAQLVSKISVEAKIFTGTIFCELVFDHKKSHYTVFTWSVYEPCRQWKFIDTDTVFKYVVRHSNMKQICFSGQTYSSYGQDTHIGNRLMWFVFPKVVQTQWWAQSTQQLE